MCSFISLKSHIIIHFMSKILYRITVLHFQLREVSLKWCTEGWQVEVILSVSIMLFRWECQSYLLINQLHKLIEIIHSACTNWSNVLYAGEMKATTKINKVSQEFSDRPWRRPWEKQGNNSLVPCFIHKGKFTLFLPETGSYSMSTPPLFPLSNAEHLLMCLISFYYTIPIRVPKRHMYHIHRKKSHGSSSTWTSAKITSYK